MKKILTGAVLYIITAPFCFGQVKWTNVDTAFGALPSTVHVFTTTDPIEGKPNIAYYVIADLKDRQLNFTTDTTYQRRFTPQQFYNKNQQPLLVVNGTFFDFATNRNLNAVIKDGKLVSYNVHSTALKGKDTLLFMHTFRSAIGISKKRKADVAWLYTDSSVRYAKAFQQVPGFYKDSFATAVKKDFIQHATSWKMQTAIAGGPVLLQNGIVAVSNN